MTGVSSGHRISVLAGVARVTAGHHAGVPAGIVLDITRPGGAGATCEQQQTTADRVVGKTKHDFKSGPRTLLRQGRTPGAPRRCPSFSLHTPAVAHVPPFAASVDRDRTSGSLRVQLANEGAASVPGGTKNMRSQGRARNGDARMDKVRRLVFLLALLVTWGVAARSASAQTAVMMPNGRCKFEVPNYSVCHQASGECYSQAGAYVGNFITDCNAAGAVATASAVSTGDSGAGGAEPMAGCEKGYSCAGGTCTSNSQCSPDDYNLICNVANDKCCHVWDGGLGGGCKTSQSPDPDCCPGGVDGLDNNAMDCSNYWNTCVYDVGYSAGVIAPVLSSTQLPGSKPRFNYIHGTWVVPPIPENPKDINLLTIWIGFDAHGVCAPGLVTARDMVPRRKRRRHRKLLEHASAVRASIDPRRLSGWSELQH